MSLARYQPRDGDDDDAISVGGADSFSVMSDGAEIESMSDRVGVESIFSSEFSFFSSREEDAVEIDQRAGDSGGENLH